MTAPGKCSPSATIPAGCARRTPIGLAATSPITRTPAPCSSSQSGTKKLVSTPTRSTSPAGALLPPPALCEVGHSCHARGRVAVRRRSVLLVAVGEAPEPLRGFRRGGVPHDPADDTALGENVVIVAPLARGTTCGVLEDEPRAAHRGVIIGIVERALLKVPLFPR
jgi:hypothetical protein